MAGIALGRVFHGFALSNYTTAANTYVADIAPRVRRAEAIGFFAATADVGMITGPVLGYVSQTAGWEAMWPVSAACVLLGLLGVVQTRRSHPSVM